MRESRLQGITRVVRVLRAYFLDWLIALDAPYLPLSLGTSQVHYCLSCIHYKFTCVISCIIDYVVRLQASRALQTLLWTFYGSDPLAQLLLQLESAFLGLTSCWVKCVGVHLVLHVGVHAYIHTHLYPL